MTNFFFSTIEGDCAGDAFLAGSFEDMAAYPPVGLGQKHGYIVVPADDQESPDEIAQRLITAADSPFAKPTGPAGCVPVAPNQFLFFGRTRQQ